MQPIAALPRELRRRIRFVLADIDDTLTLEGRLPAASLAAMERLQAAGIRVAPITGRPAGWCDHMARMWPIDGIVGENGAFYFRYDAAARRMTRRYWKPEAERLADRARLAAVRERILAQVPGCRVSADQAYREADLAIDFCEDVPPLPWSAVERIVALFTAAGAQAKVSSIHVNGWYGDYDKRAMTALLFSEAFGTNMDAAREQVIFVGDSPNDAPMFRCFPNAVGVANLQTFLHRLEALPAWITTRPGGLGFAEMVDHLLAEA
jgi:hypothetical protein